MGLRRALRISCAKRGLNNAISATKGGARLAQSLGQQDTEKIGIFKDFSSLPEADSRPPKKRDSATRFAPSF
jgi:hypothetical protein